MTEFRTQPKPKMGDLVYSEFFGAYLVIGEIKSDAEWEFYLNNRHHKAQTPLSYFNFAENIRVWSHGEE